RIGCLAGSSDVERISLEICRRVHDRRRHQRYRAPYARFRWRVAAHAIGLCSNICRLDLTGRSPGHCVVSEMNLIGSNILTIVTFLPALGSLLLLFYNRQNERSIRTFALIISLLTFIFSLHLVAHFDSSNPDFQFGLKIPWIASLGIDYSMGVDGISVFLILLTTLLSPLAILASWSIHERLKEYFIFMLLLETGMIGVFASLDFFLFYLFWEVMLVPMYFLLGIWGGQRRMYAAMKFVLYTMVGSVLMLVAIIALYFLNGSSTG